MAVFISLTVIFISLQCCVHCLDTNDLFKFASYYGDHMVLQRGPAQRAIVWGYGPSPGSKVIVSLSGKTSITTKTGDDNIWKVKLAAVTDTKPHTITAMSSAGNIVLNDVLFGDVWLCSGQSNMQFTVGQAFNATQEIADAKNFPHIRLFTVQMETSPWPLIDLKDIAENWSIPSNDTLNHNIIPKLYFSAVCWLFGKRLYKQLNYPIGLVSSVWYGTQIEEWMDPPSLKKCGVPTDLKMLRYENPADSLFRGTRRLTGPEPTTPSVIFNAMIHPLTTMTIYGTLWYQGESNMNHSSTYGCLFPAMIQSWRKLFSNNTGQETTAQFPFGFVQLAPWRNNTLTVGYPDIRWHQTADIGYVPNKNMPRVFMAAALDLPDYTSPWESIHPRDKQDIADRLLLSALPIAYNKYAGKYQGPFPTRFALIRSSKTFLITYDEDSSPINVRTRNGFDVCCSMIKTSLCKTKDATWVPAPISSYDNNTVSISYTGCASNYAVAIRYAWRESPCPFKKCAVYSVEHNLPAPPFIQQITYTSDAYNNDQVIIPDSIDHTKDEEFSFKITVT